MGRVITLEANLEHVQLTILKKQILSSTNSTGKIFLIDCVLILRISKTYGTSKTLIQTKVKEFPFQLKWPNAHMMILLLINAKMKPK